MRQYEKQIQILQDRGMFYRGVKKTFVGKIDGNTFFNRPGVIINTFGYYAEDNGTWIAFITDEERGIETITREVSTEEEAIVFLTEFTESHNFSHYCRMIMDNFDESAKLILTYLKSNYGYTQSRAEEALNYLLQVKVIAFEYWYFIKYGKYVPDKLATKCFSYTAKRLKQETGLTEFGAFNYMVYLKKKPEEALANLKNGLLRRNLFSPQDGIH